VTFFGAASIVQQTERRQGAECGLMYRYGFDVPVPVLLVYCCRECCKCRKNVERHLQHVVNFVRCCKCSTTFPTFCKCCTTFTTLATICDDVSTPKCRSRIPDRLLICMTSLLGETLKTTFCGIFRKSFLLRVTVIDQLHGQLVKS
jgi:hypothetical protein